MLVTIDLSKFYLPFISVFSEKKKMGFLERCHSHAYLLSAFDFTFKVVLAVFSLFILLFVTIITTTCQELWIGRITILINTCKTGKSHYQLMLKKI